MRLIFKMLYLYNLLIMSNFAYGNIHLKEYVKYVVYTQWS